jgi:molecular chaperone GrpE (heat shock protein)
MKRVLACVGAVLVVSFGAVACGDDDDSGQSAAEAQLCTSLEGFRAALDNVEDVQLADPEANAQNVSVDRVRATWSGVQQSAKDINEADANAIDSALGDLESAVDDLPSGITAAEAKTQLQPSIDGVTSAVTEMRNGLQCTP